MTKSDFERLAVDLANISRKMMDCAPDYAAAQKALIKEAARNIARMLQEIEEHA